MTSPSLDLKQRQVLFLSGLSILTIGLGLTIIISLSTGTTWPSSISSLAVDWSTPQARIFTACLTFAVVCILMSWCLYLPPYAPLDAFHHMIYCSGLYIVAMVPTVNDEVSAYSTSDYFYYVIHTIAALSIFGVHPILELYRFRQGYPFNQARYALSITAIVLLGVYIILSIVQFVVIYKAVSITCFIIEVVMITCVTVDVYLLGQGVQNL